VESVWTHLYTSCQSVVWSLDSDICTQDNRLMCGVFMVTSVHKNIRLKCGGCMETSFRQLSVWCVDSVHSYLYTSCQTDVWSLYGYICTQVIRLMFGICMETSVKRYQTEVWSLHAHICTQDIRLRCGVCMEISVHMFSDWYVESEWTHQYKRYQTAVWSLYGHIFTQDIRIMKESVWRQFYTSCQTEVWSLY
jgi:ribosomal protein S27AE